VTTAAKGKGPKLAKKGEELKRWTPSRRRGSRENAEFVRYVQRGGQ
jgi:hypothetical protein